MSNVVDLAQKTNNGTFASPEQLLNNNIDWSRDNPAYDKVLIFKLNSKADHYDVSFSQCGMTMSECVALCDIGKGILKSEMGY